MPEESLALVLIKIVDDVLMTGATSEMESYLKRFSIRFFFGTVVRGSVVLLLYGLKILQREDCSSTIHGNNKLDAAETFPIPCFRCRHRK